AIGLGRRTRICPYVTAYYHWLVEPNWLVIPSHKRQIGNCRPHVLVCGRTLAFALAPSPNPPVNRESDSTAPTIHACDESGKRSSHSLFAIMAALDQGLATASYGLRESPNRSQATNANPKNPAIDAAISTNAAMCLGTSRSMP